MTTIQQHCCGADVFFNKKTADKEYRNYVKRGATRATAKMIQQLEAHQVEGKSMIDVGGGIGALQWWFLENGGGNTTDIDASSGYLKQAEKHAKEKGWASKTAFLLGDCIEVYPQIDNAHFITLDKVVCCYPNYKEIVEASCDKATEAISLSYPMDGIISNVIRKLGDILMSFRDNPFRPFIHSVMDIRAIFEHKGYQRVAHKLVFPWHVETYIKR